MYWQNREDWAPISTTVQDLSVYLTLRSKRPLRTRPSPGAPRTPQGAGWDPRGWLGRTRCAGGCSLLPPRELPALPPQADAEHKNDASFADGAGQGPCCGRLAHGSVRAALFGAKHLQGTPRPSAWPPPLPKPCRARLIPAPGPCRDLPSRGPAPSPERGCGPSGELEQRSLPRSAARCQPGAAALRHGTWGSPRQMLALQQPRGPADSPGQNF